MPWHFNRYVTGIPSWKINVASTPCRVWAVEMSRLFSSLLEFHEDSGSFAAPISLAYKRPLGCRCQECSTSLRQVEALVLEHIRNKLEGLVNTGVRNAVHHWGRLRRWCWNKMSLTPSKQRHHETVIFFVNFKTRQSSNFLQMNFNFICKFWVTNFLLMKCNSNLFQLSCIQFAGEVDTTQSLYELLNFVYGSRSESRRIAIQRSKQNWTSTSGWLCWLPWTTNFDSQLVCWKNYIKIPARIQLSSKLKVLRDSH